MLYSKANLMVKGVASKEVDDQSLHCVHFAPDGATVASNRRALMAVGPVDTGRVRFPPVDGDADPPAGVGVSVGLDIVATAVKNLPKDKRVSAQHVKMTECSERKVEFTTVGLAREQRVSGRPRTERFPEWRGIFRKGRAGADQGRVCVGRRELMQLLSAMDDAAGPGDEGAVFIEFGGEADALILRCVNQRTDQRVLGLMMPVSTGGEWVRGDKWSREVLLVHRKRLLRKAER